MLRKRNLPLCCLLLAVCLVYANSFSNSFHFDDFHTVTDNPAVRSLSNIPRIFRDATAFSVLPANQTYRPVVTTSLAVDYALAHGYAPFWFHLSTMVWFLVLIATLFSLAEWIMNRTQPAPGNRWLALGVAAWFGLHPAMAETVNYVIQRGDLYCTLGCVAALCVFARYPPLRRFGVYLLPFVMAMLSKPPAAVFPLLVWMYVFFFETSTLPRARRWSTSARAMLPSLVITAVLLWLQSAMTPKSFLPSIIPAAAYRLTQPFVWMRYFGSLFLPLHLNADTDLQPFSALDGRAMAGLAFVVVLVAAIVYTARHRRLYPIAFGLLWFVITQLPTSAYALSEVENDHRMFFSFPGLMIAVVWGLHLVYRRALTAATRGEAGGIWIRRLVVTASAMCLCGYAYGAHRRNQVWRSEDALWADDVAKSPENGRGLMMYGLTRMDAGDYPTALALFQRALKYTPNYPTLEINLGVVNGLLADRGKPELEAEAERHFERAIALAPQDDTTHAYFGRWLLQRGRVPEAMEQLETAVTLNPLRSMQRDLLLNAYERAGNRGAAVALASQTLVMIPGEPAAIAVLRSGGQEPAPTGVAAEIDASQAAYRAGHFQQAIDAAREALRLDPRSPEAWNNLGAGDGGLHEWESGISAEEQALKLNPNLQIARNNLRWFQAEEAKGARAGSTEGAKTAASLVNASLALNRQGRYEASIVAAREALKLDPESAEAWNNIAAADEAMHRWDEAIVAAERAVAIRPDFQLAKNNLAWSLEQKRLERVHAEPDFKHDARQP